MDGLRIIDCGHVIMTGGESKKNTLNGISGNNYQNLTLTKWNINDNNCGFTGTFGNLNFFNNNFLNNINCGIVISGPPNDLISTMKMDFQYNILTNNTEGIYINTIEQSEKTILANIFSNEISLSKGKALSLDLNVESNFRVYNNSFHDNTNNETLVELSLGSSIVEVDENKFINNFVGNIVTLNSTSNSDIEFHNNLFMNNTNSFSLIKVTGQSSNKIKLTNNNVKSVSNSSIVSIETAYASNTMVNFTI